MPKGIYERKIIVISDETRKKMSLIKKGKKPWNKGIKMWENRQHPKGMLGKKASNETKMKMSLSRLGMRSGSKSHLWKGGITPINTQIRQSFEYKLWRKSVFERDNYTCIWCKQHGGKLNADHIKPFALFPELRFAIDNGRTLCIDCHRTTDTWGGRYKLKDK